MRLGWGIPCQQPTGSHIRSLQSPGAPCNAPLPHPPVYRDGADSKVLLSAAPIRMFCLPIFHLPRFHGQVTVGLSDCTLPCELSSSYRGTVPRPSPPPDCGPGCAPSLVGLTQGPHFPDVSLTGIPAHCLVPAPRLTLALAWSSSGLASSIQTPAVVVVASNLHREKFLDL